MTIVVDTRRTPAALVAANLRKLVPGARGQRRHPRCPPSTRDLALIRVRCAPGERAEIADLVDIFRGALVDVAPESVIVEVTGDEEKVDGLVELLRPRGILEMVRTGKVAMVRGTVNVAGTERERASNGNGSHGAHGDTENSKERRRMARIYYDNDADLEDLGRADGGHHRLRQPGPRARAEPARQRRERGGGAARGEPLAGAGGGRGPDGADAGGRGRAGATSS